MAEIRKASVYQGLAASLVAGRYLDLGSEVTTAPTTALNKGYTFIAWDGTRPSLGCVWTSAGNGIKYIPFTTKTMGRATA